MKRTVIILDAGHGIDTPGKRSPVWSDGSQLFEYEFNRDVCARVAKQLVTLGLRYKLLIHELNDVSLAIRCNRANLIARSEGDAILVSIHGNAGGGTGWECWTTPGKTKADLLASCFYDAAKKAFPEKRMRTDFADGDPDKESPFYILKNTICPAVLTENFFMDTEEDCRLMMSHEGRDRIASLHIEAIKDYLK